MPNLIKVRLTECKFSLIIFGSFSLFYGLFPLILRGFKMKIHSKRLAQSLNYKTNSFFKLLCRCGIGWKHILTKEDLIQLSNCVKCFKKVTYKSKRLVFVVCSLVNKGVKNG